MKGDFTRRTFDPAKRYSGVRLQQGRVGLDADFNEQADLEAFLRETALADVVGPCGVPAREAESETGGGFRIEVAEDGDLSIAPGHLYVDGLRVEMPEPGATYLDQPDLPDTGLPEEESMLLAAGLVGLAQVSARYWLSARGSIPREAAAELVASLGWRGIRGFPRKAEDGRTVAGGDETR